VVPIPGDEDDGEGRGRGVDLGDVLVDEDVPPTKDVIDDPPPDARPTEPARDPAEDKGDALAFNDPDDGSEDGGSSKSASKDGGRRKSRLDDDGPADDGSERLARADLDDEGRKIDSPTIDDEVKDPGDDKPRRGHMLALQAGFLGSTWQYHFNGAIDTGGPQPDKFTADVVAGFYPGAMGRVDFWPLEWVGVEADGSLSAIQFKLNADGGAAINPSEFVAIHGTAGAFAKARYVFGSGLPGLGVGARLGYRFWGASVEAQTLSGGPSNGAALTVVPGFAFHALAVGLEVAVPVRLLDRRLEVELRADGLPATFYKEEPDNPGQSSLAFGWSASFCARYEIFAGFFAELGLNTVGATVDYKGVPEQPRQTLDARNNPVPLAGGSVLNWTGGFNLGAGYMF
jgi:hypothetical protein